jgi:hypothetical protein
MCPKLGVEKKSFSAHHKSHINKVMGHATVPYMFWDNPENGGKGFLIGLHRCQNFKVVARTINVTTIDPVTRKQKRKGNPVWPLHRGHWVELSYSWTRHFEIVEKNFSLCSNSWATLIRINP